MEIIKSFKGNDHYINEGYTHRFDNILQNSSIKVYRCTKKECKGRLKDFQGRLEIVTPHNSCVPNPAKKSKKNMKQGKRSRRELF